MPTFTGSLRDFGLELLTGLEPELIFTAESLGVTASSTIYATPEVTVTPTGGGELTITLATTVGLVPRVRIKLSIRYLGSGGYDELPFLLDVPETGGTIADLILASSGATASELIFIGTLPPPAGSSWWRWLDTSGVPKYPELGEVPGDSYLRAEG